MTRWTVRPRPGQMPKKPRARKLLKMSATHRRMLIFTCAPHLLFTALFVMFLHPAVWLKWNMEIDGAGVYCLRHGNCRRLETNDVRSCFSSPTALNKEVAILTLELLFQTEDFIIAQFACLQKHVDENKNKMIHLGIVCVSWSSLRRLDAKNGNKIDKKDMNLFAGKVNICANRESNESHK